MKRIILIPTLIALIAGSVAAEDNTLSDAEKKEGWKLLFDGNTLDGWNSWKTKKPLDPGGAWSAEDGTLALTRKGGGDIYTAESFKNYEFMVEWKTTGNSGILIRVDPSSKGAIWHKAPEMQVDKGNPNSKGSTSAGGLYALYEISGEKKFNPQGWNRVKIRMDKGHGTHWFNGIQIADYQIGSEDWNARVQKSKFRKYPGFALTENGHLGFQDHGARVQFKNIKIRVLP